MSEQSEGIAGQENRGDNLSVEQLIASRSRQLLGNPESEESQAEAETQEEETEESQETTEETESESTEEQETTETEETDEEEESTDIDFLSLEPEQIQELARKGKSRLLHRIGELTAQKKALEEKLNQTAQANSKPLPSVPAEENPFRDLTDVESLNAKFDEVEKVLEETDRLLEDHEDYGPDDVITFAGKEFTKKQIRTANRNARNAITKFLPAQAQTLQRKAALEQAEAQYDDAISKEVPEALDPESDLGKRFSALVSDPLVAEVKTKVPELGHQMKYLLAHALRSITELQGQKAKPKLTTAAGEKPKAKVPGDPFGAGAAKSSLTPAKRSAVEAAKRFEKTGSVEDWIAARAARLTNH